MIVGIGMMKKENGVNMKRSFKNIKFIICQMILLLTPLLSLDPLTSWKIRKERILNRWWLMKNMFYLQNIFTKGLIRYLLKRDFSSVKLMLKM